MFSFYSGPRIWSLRDADFLPVGLFKFCIFLVSVLTGREEGCGWGKLEPVQQESQGWALGLLDAWIWPAQTLSVVGRMSYTGQWTNTGAHKSFVSMYRKARRQSNRCCPNSFLCLGVILQPRSRWGGEGWRTHSYNISVCIYLKPVVDKVLSHAVPKDEKKVLPLQRQGPVS